LVPQGKGSIRSEAPGVALGIDGQEMMMAEQFSGGEQKSLRPTRPVGPAVLRGLIGRCPNCGEGRLFGSWLKSVHACANCGEVLDVHRADDFPAYLVILVVGHIVVGGFLAVEAAYPLSSFQHLAIWVPLTVILSVALLQPVKGAVIGLQWALYMHGFGGNKDAVRLSP
jgi:uncharacterized protein (DUF983 family)